MRNALRLAAGVLPLLLTACYTGSPPARTPAERALARGVATLDSALVASALQEGASPYAPYGTDAGSSSFHVAISRADCDLYRSIAKLLLDAGADPNRPDGPLETPPLHMAPDSATVSLLVRFGADLDGRDMYGWNTPLHAAAKHGFSSVVRELIRLGADPNARGTGGGTPLHEAAQYSGSPEVAKALLAAGADVNVHLDGGSTPLDLYRARRSFLLPIPDSAATARDQRDTAFLRVLYVHGAKHSGN